MVQIGGSHLAPFLQSPGWGREVPEQHDPWDGVGPSLASQTAAMCHPREDLPLQNPQVCPAGRLWGSFLLTAHSFWVLYGCGGGGGSALEWKGLEDGNRMLPIFLALGQRNGGLLAF